MSHPVFPGRGPTSPIQIASRPDPRISPRAQLSLTAWITATLTAGVCAFGAAITPSLDTRIVFASLALGAYLFALLALIAPAEEQFGLPRLRLASWLLFYSVFAYGLATVTLASPQEGLQAVLNRETTVRAIVFVGYRTHRNDSRISNWTNDAFHEGSHHNSNDRATSIPKNCEEHCWFGLRLSSGVGFLVFQAVSEGRLGYAGGADITSNSDVPIYAQILTVFTSLSTIALYGLATRLAEEDRMGDRALVLVLGSVQFLIGLLSGRKEEYLMVLIAIGVPFLLRRRRLPFVKLVVALLIFIFVVTPFVTAFRESIRTQEKRLDLTSSIAIGFNMLTSRQFFYGTERTGSADPTQTTVSRVRLIDNLIIIIDKTPTTIPYRDGGEMVAAPVLGVVPRFLWPDKPARLGGLEFYKTYWGGQGLSSSAITMQGSLYMYGGSAILFVGMLLFGWFIRGIDETIVRFEPYRAGLLALVLFAIIVKQELDAASLLAGIPVLLATYYVGVLSTTRPSVA